jgi:hypothetical protein
VNATDKQRKEWEFIGGGIGIHWEEIDEDISVASLLSPERFMRLANTTLQPTSRAHRKSRTEAIQSMEKTMKSKRIPDADSIEELAKFWDTHDLIDFEVQLEEVRRPVFKRLKESTVAIDLTPKEAKDLKRLADSEGTQEATLVRTWIRQMLRESSLRKPPNKPLQPPAQKTRRG